MWLQHPKARWHDRIDWNRMVALTTRCICLAIPLVSLFAWPVRHHYTCTPDKEAHDLRFELIDQVLEQDAERLRAVKNVTVAEEYLADHFPGFAVLPGVMMLETLVQAGRRLLEARAEPGEPWILAEVRNVRYGNMVRPGQALTVEVTLRKAEEGCYDFAGVGMVGEQVAVQARFQLAPLAPSSPLGA